MELNEDVRLAERLDVRLVESWLVDDGGERARGDVGILV